MPSHLQDFAHELVARHGSRTLGMILHGFTNMGYQIPGATVDEQYEALAKAIEADPRLVVVGDNPGRGGDWIGLKKEDEVASNQ
ncbi:hypothetical protein [Rhizobium rhizogenes]|uniref:hypothetical protein n=1 Tax=Rhizobium rhizogenes TaxID=359 RepID=UPI0004D51A85|nr:hypothetical protein [Rhizobium rhizogenes]KEA07128.1 hypothetical protein CN09_09255 [Rhizobium rhizogenes]NTI80443.1 hypothetical protein [Rhizobium rhizogenes]NTJ22629.1 hypothetical protein [Rhizobium rhizogenes]QUE81332.1 hypothetical protein EML492_05870 [Rhizobium rhizogenes]TQO80571.1 hypothetical protein FFE80_05570 [Rhizobium rhizogenes]